MLNIIQVFINIPFHKGACIPSLTFQEFWDVNIWSISKLNVHYIALHGISWMSTLNLCLRKGTWWGFGHDWNGTLEPFPDWKEGQIPTPREFIVLKTFVIEQKPKMQYLHGSSKINVVTWNSYYKIRIVI